MHARSVRRGFTLIELVIVIAVIAILAVLLVPIILGQVDRARVAAERESIGELAKAMRRFKLDTGSWPFADSVWNVATDVNATQFTQDDTGLFANGGAVPLQPCNAMNLGTNCWGGPYIVQTQVASGVNPTFIDAWHRPRMFIMIRPFDGGGGGTPGAPNGFVSVWSTGADGLDQYGCFGGVCTRDLDRMAAGSPSGAPSDDIIVVAGPAR